MTKLPFDRQLCPRQVHAVRRSFLFGAIRQPRDATSEVLASLWRVIDESHELHDPARQTTQHPLTESKAWRKVHLNDSCHGSVQHAH